MALIAGWKEKMKTALRYRLPKLMEEGPSFTKVCGGRTTIMIKTKVLADMLERECQLAMVTMYNEAVSEEVSLHEYKKGLSYAQKRKLQEPRRAWGVRLRPLWGCHMFSGPEGPTGSQQCPRIPLQTRFPRSHSAAQGR